MMKEVCEVYPVTQGKEFICLVEGSEGVFYKKETTAWLDELS